MGPCGFLTWVYVVWAQNVWSWSWQILLVELPLRFLWSDRKASYKNRQKDPKQVHPNVDNCPHNFNLGFPLISIPRCQRLKLYVLQFAYISFNLNMIMTGGKVGRESQLKNLGVVTEYIIMRLWFSTIRYSSNKLTWIFGPILVKFLGFINLFVPFTMFFIRVSPFRSFSHLPSIWVSFSMCIVVAF